MSVIEVESRPHIATGGGPKFGVIQFPGSNCDQDAYFVLKDLMEKSVKYIWHQERTLGDVDVVVLPGGFSYGDYLRTGAVARFAPIMEAVIAHAERGGYILGICNGFQVLCESHLLPGALVRNVDCKFLCQYVNLKVENADTPFTSAYKPGQILRIPIAHGEGRYVCDEQTLQELEANRRILFRYTDTKGALTEAGNPNGSLDSIAGIANANFNVLGMMPHPERACESLLGSADGLGVFTSLVSAFV